MFSKNQLSLSLKKISEKYSLLDKWKVIYRPYICPFDFILNNVKKGESYFDIGCGQGAFLYLVKQFFHPKKIGGVEIKGSLVEECKKILGEKANKFIQVYNGRILPDDVKSYDNVFLIDVFHHIPQKEQSTFIDEVYEKMTTGSKFYFKDIDAGSPLVYFNKLHDLVISKEVGNEITYKSALNQLQMRGFKILLKVKVRNLWYPHYLIICQK